VPKPRVNLARFHGVFAPNSKHRPHVTPARRGKGNPSQSEDRQNTRTASPGHDLGATSEARDQYRRFGLPEVRRRIQGDSQYRGSDALRIFLCFLHLSPLPTSRQAGACQGSGLRAQGSGLRAQGSGLRAQGSGLRAQCLVVGCFVRRTGPSAVPDSQAADCARLRRPF
jgi:hypothetical protein